MSERQVIWVDVKDAPGLQALTLSIHAFGETTSKEWIRADIPDWHWKRIVEIAETSAEHHAEPAGLGFSWVTDAVVDGRAIQLNRPEHLAEVDSYLRPTAG